MTILAAAYRATQPAAMAWHRASHDRDCPNCRRQIKVGTLVAHVPTPFGGRHVCDHCTKSPRPA